MYPVFKRGHTHSFPKQTALETIQLKTINLAKEKIFSDKTVNEVAYELGFRYPQHFSRIFKQRVGVSPNEFRKSG